MKFAFVYEVGGPFDGKLFCETEGGDSTYRVVGAPAVDETLPVVKELIEEGFTAFNFCGAYDDEMMEAYQKELGPNVGLKACHYLPEQMEMLEAMTDFGEYGIIVCADNIEETKEFELNNKACNAKVAFAGSLEESLKAAKKMADNGIYFIETCGWFDDDKLREVIKVTENKFPVGAARPRA